MSSKTTLSIFLAFFLGGLAWGVLPEGYFERSSRSVSISSQHPEQTKSQITTELGTFAKLAQELKPSVVNISVVKQVPGEYPPTERIPKGFAPEASGQGSGVIISSDGDVLTNNHVVDGAQTISVKLSDGRVLEADIVGTDSNTDLALLKLQQAAELPVAQLGDSDGVAVGEWVMAIGNPFGLEATVTVGVLSGKGRVIGAGPYDDFLQTDASINPGNSGGPLFNTKGQVIGINTAIVPGGQGIGFSIPINIAKDVVDELQSKGRVIRGFIGVGIQPLTPALKTALGLDSKTTGALVASLIDDSPARAAGLDISDVIVAVDNNRIASDRELLREVARLQIGSEVPFTVVREEAEHTIFIRITERPSKESASTTTPDYSHQRARVGVAVTEVLDGSETVVIVTDVLPGSPAFKAGISKGDLIRAVGATPINSAHQFIQTVAQIKGHIALLIDRQGQTTFVVIEE